MKKRGERRHLAVQGPTTARDHRDVVLTARTCQLRPNRGPQRARQRTVAEGTTTELQHIRGRPPVRLDLLVPNERERNKGGRIREQRVMHVPRAAGP